MAAPEFADKVIEPPLPNMNTSEMYVWLYDVWNRTGGFETYIVNLMGLQASVQELNTLVGINTNFTVQAQLNLKFNVADAGTMATQDADDVDIAGGLIVDVTISDSTINDCNVSGTLRMKVGTSSTFAKCGASLHTDYTDVGNTNGSENNLMTYSLPANSLTTAGDYVDIEIWGTFAANVNNKRIRLYFGATVIYDSGVLAANAGDWHVSAKIMAKAAADQKTIATVISSNALLTASAQSASPSQDASSAITIKTTGLAVAANDIIQKGFTVKWFAAA